MSKDSSIQHNTSIIFKSSNLSNLNDSDNIEKDPTYIPIADEPIASTSKVDKEKSGKFWSTPEDYITISEDSDETAPKKVNKKNNRRITREYNLNRSRIIIDTENEEQENTGTDGPLLSAFSEMSATEVCAKGLETLKKMENIRKRSGKLQDKLSEELKAGIIEVKDVIIALMRKVNAKGDIELIRAEHAKGNDKNNQVTIENNKLKQELVLLQEQVKMETERAKKEREEYKEDRNNRKRKRKRLTSISPTSEDQEEEKDETTKEAKSITTEAG